VVPSARPILRAFAISGSPEPLRCVHLGRCLPSPAGRLKTPATLYRTLSARRRVHAVGRSIRGGLTRGGAGLDLARQIDRGVMRTLCTLEPAPRDIAGEGFS
jgi:hypothetical protein